MFRQLKLYYFFVTLPFALLLGGAVFFFHAIKGTIDRNPHPQINYVIFTIILVGGILIIFNVHRLVREARTLLDFSQAVKAKTDLAILQKMANGYTVEISNLLQLVAASAGRSISHQEQVAIEHELSNARTRLGRRNALPQYLSGLLVGMGLLGTFIGLLSTLSDISTLISSFADLDMNKVAPIQVFRVMIERMKAPMQSMSIAFSASMFGLLGSIILGLMMVGIRRLQGDIVSLLSSEISRHIETALSHESAASESSGEVASAHAGDGYKVLVRIEQRLSEAARLQQQTLSAEIGDFREQRADMLRTISELTEATHNFRSELQQLGGQLGSVFGAFERGNGEISSQLSELTVQLVGGARESHKLLAMQVDEQKRLRDTLDSCKVEERLAEAARLQQRRLSTEIEEFQNQRADMLRTLTDQTEASNKFRRELQEVGRQLSAVSISMNKGNDEIRTQISELMIHMAADAKELQNLLALQVNDQKR
ncbi:MAG TPA: hypothetical protein VI298_18170 [Geobacteraceae bacterium]